MRSDEHFRRHDVCFFCGYTICIAEKIKCPECGKGRPTADKFAQVRRSLRIGIAGVIAVVLVMAVDVPVYGYARLRGDPYRMLVTLWFGAPFVVVAELLWPWVHVARAHGSRRSCD